MAVREGLLVLLTEGPRYGYQLKTDWESATGGSWTINVGQIYSTLERLVRDDLVEMSETDDQKLYEITPRGKEHLHDWWNEVPALSPMPRDGLVVKILLAVATGPEHALDVITRHRSTLTATLQRTRQAMRARAAAETENGASGHTNGGDTSATRTGDESPLARALVDDAVIARTESDLRWLDQCEHRIIRSRREAPSSLENRV